MSKLEPPLGKQPTDEQVKAILNFNHAYQQAGLGKHGAPRHRPRAACGNANRRPQHGTAHELEP